jgi:hypothetical protein
MQIWSRCFLALKAKRFKLKEPSCEGLVASFFIANLEVAHGVGGGETETARET